MAPIRQEGGPVVSEFARPVDWRKRRECATRLGHTNETLRRAKHDHAFAAPGASKKFIPPAIADGLGRATRSFHFLQLACRRKGNETAVGRPNGNIYLVLRANQRA